MSKVAIRIWYAILCALIAGVIPVFIAHFTGGIHGHFHHLIAIPALAAITYLLLDFRHKAGTISKDVALGVGAIYLIVAFILLG